MRCLISVLIATLVVARTKPDNEPFLHGVKDISTQQACIQVLPEPLTNCRIAKEN